MMPPGLIMGLPPFGRGGYVRDSLESYVTGFAALNAWRSDVAAQVAQAKARGLNVWLYGTPENWRPNNWRTSLGRIVDQCTQLGCIGIIADPEGGWEGASAQARALGSALADAASTVRVGVTSYPMWPHLRALAAETRGKVWGSPQIYGRSAQGAATFESWYAPWREAFGSGKVIPSVAGWASSDALATRQGFRSYLETIPAAPGCIVWDGVGPAPAFIVQALSEWEPRNMLPMAVSALAMQPIVIATLAIVAVTLGAVALRK